jgi:hypothetical protein
MQVRINAQVCKLSFTFNCRCHVQGHTDMTSALECSDRDMYPPKSILTATIFKIRTADLISPRAIFTQILAFTHIPVEGHVNSRVSPAPSSPVNTVLMHDMCMAVLPPRPYYWPHQHRAPAAIHSMKRPRCQMLKQGEHVHMQVRHVSTPMRHVIMSMQVQGHA